MFGATLIGFVENVRFADLLDVVLVGALIYFGISWLRGGASRTVVVLTTATLGVLFLARTMSLYLTQMVVEALFAVFIIAFVVLFRDEIRRELDRLTARGRLRRELGDDDLSRMMDTLVTAAARMAREHIGALIVLAGRESWDRSVTGGVELDGKVSEPLLYSIFNVDSPGHDGAVLIDHNGRIVRFSAHLPLSNNLSEVGSRGTRHTAALGLSEQCDALVIVVSEERGEISVARGGRLETLKTATQLSEDLEAFRREIIADHTRARRSLWSWQDVAMAGVSLVVAGALWAVFAYPSDMAYRTFEVPIEFLNPREGFTLTDAGPTEARVVVGGPSPAFRQLDPQELRFGIDLSEVTVGENVLRLTREAINLPSDLRLYNIQPQVVRVTAAPADESQPEEAQEGAP